MRWKHWLKTIVGGSLLTASALTAQAQSPYDGGGPMNGFAPDAMYGAGPPAAYSPWPQLSPYSNSYSQQYVDQGGLWNQDQNNLARRYLLNIDYFTGKTRSTNAFIGNRDAQNYVAMIRPQIGGQQGGGGAGQQQDPLSQFTNDPRTGLRGFELYGAVNYRQGGPQLDSDGTRIVWGYDRADNSGIRLGFLYNTDTDFLYNALDHQQENRGTQSTYAQQLIQQLHQLNELQTQGNTAAAAQLSAQIIQQQNRTPTSLTEFFDPSLVLANNIHNLNGLPLDDGTVGRLSDGTLFGGVTVPYDMQFKVDIRTELYGGQADWVMSPVVTWGSLRIRPTVGARYFYLNEAFRFFGMDSGLAYGTTQAGGGGGAGATVGPDIKLHSTPDRIDNNSDGVVDNAGTVEGGQGQGGGGAGQQQSVFQTFRSFHDQFRYPITSTLNNTAEAHLGGGLVGLMYDFGGESFLLSGATRVGLLANYTQIKMKGDNIAMHTRDSNLILPSPSDATPNSFSDTEIHSHMSPALEQTFNAEAPLFQYVPVLRRVRAFEKARFRLGYSFLVIGEVTDTANSIHWRGNPSQNIFPQIHGRRNTYVTHGYNFGVSWAW